MYQVLLFKSRRHLCKGSIVKVIVFFLEGLGIKPVPRLSLLCLPLLNDKGSKGEGAWNEVGLEFGRKANEDRRSKTSSNKQDILQRMGKNI